MSDQQSRQSIMSGTNDSLHSAASSSMQHPSSMAASAAATAMQAMQAQQQTQKDRIPLALHYPQSAINPGSSYSNPANGQPATPTLGGAGYGPPVLTTFTPIQKLVHETTELKRDYDLVCLPLTNARWKDRWERMCLAEEPYDGMASQKKQGNAAASAYEAERWRSGGGFSRGEVNVTRSDETRLLVALASEWLELDSEVEGIRFDSEIALKQEVAYASHLHISSLILPMPRNPAHIADYARSVNAALMSCSYMHIAIRIPISSPLPNSPSVASTSHPSSLLEESASSPWDTWNFIRQYCSYSNRLHVCLDLTYPIPPSPLQLQRWQAESIKAVWLPATAFIPNAKGYPVLSKSLQAFLKSVFKYKPSVILSGTQVGLHANGGQEAYAQYIRFLERKMPPPTPVEQYAGGYLDYLQAPLQPLMDNLESDTYEGFEKDPIKYQQYEEAVYQALMDMPPIQSGPVEIFVAGAGRGPLVAGCLKAAKRAGGKRVKITAIEKNPNAYVVLQERKAIEWGSYVDLVFTDMRTWHPPNLADIIVSELLGSFGDNELSPECLDGIIPRLLKPGGISIPYSYTAFLAPLTSAKLHEQVTTANDIEKAEQPYVVMFSQALIISEHQPSDAPKEKVQACWNFVHPRNDVILDEQGLPLTNSHNSRSAQLSFWIPNASVCHGFGGYFSAQLYGDVSISIHPETGDPNMLSWFPLFFPLREPLYLPARSELDVNIWRLTDPVKRRIWFEWSAEAYLPVSGLPGSASISMNGTGSTSYLNPRPMTPGTPAWGDAFASAPSPALNRNPNEPFSLEQQQQEAMSKQQRIKIGMTRLHNPQGRSSWVGL